MATLLTFYEGHREGARPYPVAHAREEHDRHERDVPMITTVEARPTRYQRPRELVKVYRALRFVSELHLKM